MTARSIASRQHALVRRFRDAVVSRGEEVLLDGEHLIQEAIAAAVRITVVLARDPEGAVAREAARAGAEVFGVTAPVLDAASPVRTPSGIVALAKWTTDDVAAALAVEARTVIGLVDVQNPGNVGAVIRSADAFGGGPVLALGQTADPAGWKALRGAMGSTFRIPIGRGALDEAVAQARTRRYRIAATVAHGGTTIRDVDWSERTLVLFGSEGAGLPHDVVRAADLQVTIPMRRAIESLNVAMAAAVSLYEAWR